MVGFSRTQLDAFRGATVPDLVGGGLRLLFVGINPGLWTAAVQAHFARRGNRFYPALYDAGITDHVIDASAGMSPADAAHLLERGVGITNVVPYATARADEIDSSDFVAGAAALTRRVAALRPSVVAILGIGAYRVGFERPRAVSGLQPDRLAGAQLWVVPNPSGLNAHATRSTLAACYREVAIAAGISPIEQDSAAVDHQKLLDRAKTG